MNDILWYLTRSSGVVAMVLMSLAVIDGLLFSGRQNRRTRPVWLMDLHRGLGGYALAFTGLHLVSAYSAGLGYSIVAVVVPGVAKESTIPLAFGIIAFYIMSISVLTSWPKRLLPRKFWHFLHVLSIPALILVGLHGWQMGSDSRIGWYIAVTLVLTAITVYPFALRLTAAWQKRVEKVAVRS